MSYRVNLTLKDVNGVWRYTQYNVMSMWEVKRLQKMVGTKWDEDEVIEIDWYENSDTDTQ